VCGSGAAVIRFAAGCVVATPAVLEAFRAAGISEVPNDRDEEFGLARVEQLLMQHSAEPLPQIWERIMEHVRQHGLQQADQTLLLVRVRH
jgi:hypothetical protein